MQGTGNFRERVDMRGLAGLIMLMSAVGAISTTAAGTAAGSLGVGVIICGTGTPGCNVAAKPRLRHLRVARSGFVPRAAFLTPRYTCGAAAISLAKIGYTAIRRIDCKGRLFTYSARKDGKRYLIKVEAGSARIKSIRATGDGQRRSV